jgi:fumarate reductase flavoprotein subunit
MVTDMVPIRPVVHYMMGGIHTDINAATPMPGLFAAGECACVSINGANRLGSNSLTELLVFGRRAAESAIAYLNADAKPTVDTASADRQAADAEARIQALFDRRDGGETIAGIRDAMANSMESGAGIYRSEELLKDTTTTLADLRARQTGIALKDKSKVFNTELTQTLELSAMLDVAQAVAVSALERKESRGSHQRLDYTERDDTTYLRHSMAHHRGEDAPAIDYLDVVITKSQPGVRDYSGAKS